ncbi:hypothetical protein BCON_0024g00360 [Botryotinia convoluta]|uniref:Uncharacterized protein n=1 Tax=Botryotinia convoluta TaxID=54673 RepID=A0A4Z1IMS7_9HELO|nr:hypothetical protein BCON_0024g00360 [Botryotinia convoluta]
MSLVKSEEITKLWVFNVEVSRIFLPFQDLEFTKTSMNLQILIPYPSNAFHPYSPP